MTAEQIIQRLNLQPHPVEGGYFRETYRSAANFDPGPPYPGSRSHGTAIYYLLTPDTFSAMHRLPGDEVFHFYLGDPVDMLELRPEGESRVLQLGQEIERMKVQHVVHAGVWQGSRLAAGGKWALLGATMAPGFSYDDYESGTASLIGQYPTQADRISSLLADDAAS